MGSPAILYYNYADLGTLEASNEVVNMEIEYLTSSPHITDDVYRSVTNSINFTLTLAANVNVDTIALFGLILSASATIRVRVSTLLGGSTSGDVHDVTYDATDPEFDPDYMALVVLLAVATSARFVRFDIVDTTLDYIEIGRLVVGTRVDLAYGFVSGAQLDWVDPSVIEKSRGGQSLVWERPRFREATIDLPLVSTGERWGLIEELGRANGRHKDILLVMDVEADNLPQQSIWGLVPTIGPASWTNIPGQYSKQIHVEERR